MFDGIAESLAELRADPQSIAERLGVSLEEARQVVERAVQPGVTAPALDGPPGDTAQFVAAALERWRDPAVRKAEITEVLAKLGLSGTADAEADLE